MVAGGVTEEVGVVGGEEGLGAECRNARPAAVEHVCGGPDDKPLVTRKSRFAEPIVKASQPAAAMSAICSLVLTLPALTR